MLILLAAAALAAVVIFFIVKSSKKRMKEENQYQAERKARDESLDEMLSNPHNQGEDKDVAYRPYKISYSTGGPDEAVSNNTSMYRLTERTERVQKVYLFKRDEAAYIGEGGDGAAVWKNPEEKTIYCKIAFRQGTYYVRATGAAPIKVTRKKKQAAVDQKGLCLKNQDVILLLNREFLFEIIK